MRRTIVAVALALTVVLAGCAGAGDLTTTANTAGADGTTTGGTAGGPNAASLGFYVSDRPGAIEDFAHLNVTITRIGLHHTGNATADDEGDENETSTTTTTTATTTTTTTTVAENETTTAERENETEHETTEQAETEQNETEHETEHAETENETESGSGYWVERDVNNTTVDLTQLRGENATLLDQLSVPAGSYDKVFAYVSNVNGTLTTGEHVNVKLPSQKLHVNSEFTLGENDSTHFVYDVSVVKAGKSGKYVVKPVVSETGLEKPMKVIEGDHERENEREHDQEDEHDGEQAGALDVSLAGNVTAGENATLQVTENGSAVANATVSVNGEEVGATDANGTITVTVPDEDRVRVTAETTDEHGVLTVRLDGGAGSGDGGDHGGEKSGEHDDGEK